MTFELEPIGKYFRVKKGLGYLGKYLKPASVGLIGLNSFEGGGGYKYGGEKQYSGPFKPEQIAHPGDLFISTTDITQDGRVLASPFILPDLSESFQTVIFSGDIVKAIKKSDGLLPEFLFNVLRVKRYREKAAYASSGTTVRRIPAEVIESLEVPVPPIKTQIAINETLGGLDSKIRLNSQLSKTLEDIAQTIFQSWFIDFGPVKAKMAGEKPVGMDDATAALFPDSTEDSELGQIPKGWTSGVLDDVLVILDSRRIPISSAERKKRVGEFPYYGATGILDYIDDYLFEGPHVLVGEDGTVITDAGTPLVQYVWSQFWVSNHAHVLQGTNGFSVEQIKLLLDRIKIANFITGAVQPKLNQGNLKSVPCLIPKKDVSEAFNQMISPMFGQIRLLHDESNVLISVRDALLPRLISGELQIPEEMLAS